MQSILSICIPTFNRSAKLRECIEHLIPQISKYEITIYISDNASTDSTSEVVSELSKIYSLISYSRNETNLGADCNFEIVLKKATSDYAWLLGDDDRIVDGSIEKVLNKISSKKFDMVIVNGGEKKSDSDGNTRVHGRVGNYSSRVINDKNELLSELGWHMTWMSCLIYSSKVINDADYRKFHGTYLLQFAIIFDCLAAPPVSICWISEECVYALPDTVTPAWVDRTFEIWAESWFNVVYNLPSQYDIAAKLKCIRRHAVESRVISLRQIYEYRKHGHYSIEHFRKYKQYWEFVTNVPVPVMYLMSVLPVGILKIAKDLKQCVFGK